MRHVARMSKIGMHTSQRDFSSMQVLLSCSSHWSSTGSSTSWPTKSSSVTWSGLWSSSAGQANSSSQFLTLEICHLFPNFSTNQSVLSKEYPKSHAETSESTGQTHTRQDLRISNGQVFMNKQAVREDDVPLCVASSST